MSDLVRDPENRFSHDMAKMIPKTLMKNFISMTSRLCGGVGMVLCEYF